MKPGTGSHSIRNGTSGGYEPGTDGGGGTGVVEQTPVYRRFHGSVEINDLLRFGCNAGHINEEVLTHLTGLQRANVRVTIEIQGDFPEGVDDRVREIVQENASALHFTQAEFEPE